MKIAASVDALLTTLKELGIDEKDIQTGSFNVFAERYFGGPQNEEEVQYRVSNSVTVIIRDLDKVGEVLDASIKAGANNIYGVEFLLEDATAARSEARKLAVESAKANAEELAALTGVKVGRILSISEVIGSGGGFYGNSISAFQLGLGGSGAPPVQPGQPADHHAATDHLRARGLIAEGARRLQHAQLAPISLGFDRSACTLHLNHEGKRRLDAP